MARWVIIASTSGMFSRASASSVVGTGCGGRDGSRSAMFGDPLRGEALRGGDLIRQRGDDELLDGTAEQRNPHLQRAGEAQPGTGTTG